MENIKDLVKGLEDVNKEYIKHVKTIIECKEKIIQKKQQNKTGITELEHKISQSMLLIEVAHQKMKLIQETITYELAMIKTNI